MSGPRRSGAAAKAAAKAVRKPVGKPAAKPASKAVSKAPVQAKSKSPRKAPSKPNIKPIPKRVAKHGWLPQPLLSLGLAGAWLMLQQSLAPAQLLTAVVLALAIPLLLRGLLAEGSRVPGPVRRLHALGVALRLLLVVLWDIVLSNLTVARIVLNPACKPQPAWVPVALDVQHPTAIVLLASIITTTPGTVSCVVDEQRRQILVHALDCADGPALAAQIKQRYEQPLREIFE